MNRTPKSSFLRVSISLFVLLAVLVLPTYGQPSPKVDPATKAKVAALIEKLKDKDVDVREKAARDLGDIGPAAKDAVPALIVALKDKDKNVRKYAAGALGRIGPAAKDAVPALIVALTDKDGIALSCRTRPRCWPRRSSSS